MKLLSILPFISAIITHRLLGMALAPACTCSGCDCSAASHHLAVQYGVSILIGILFWVITLLVRHIHHKPLANDKLILPIPEKRRQKPCDEYTFRV